MCGIAGVFDRRGHPVAGSTIQQMCDVVSHRGPDGHGVWTDGVLGLGHRRLKIIDLTEAGRQPMSNETADVVVVYNGEIYNHQQLRVELQAAGHVFHSRTDTEVIIHGYEEWGESCLSRFNGIFAFALWDARRRRLWLARDRFGVKPLYYSDRGGLLVFGSEIKSILKHPQVTPNICVEALQQYFTFQNILTDLTLFEGIRLLPPGHQLFIDADDAAPPLPQRYWDVSFGLQHASSTEQEVAEEIKRLFEQAVTRQLISDVPVGAYLSGGMDSGSITAVARRQIGRLTTFTAGFDLSSASGIELSFDERAQAEALSNLIKTEHYETVLHAGDMEHIMPELIWHLEDLRVGQCYPNYYVARLAGKFVRVVLSGAGGDELFGGYPWRYQFAHQAPSADAFLRSYYGFWQRLVPDAEQGSFFSDRVRQELGDRSMFDLFRGVINQSDRSLDDAESRVNAALYFESKTFLHGLLIVEDKVSMAHALEARVPFLDNDLAEFAAGLHPKFKLRAPDTVASPVREDRIDTTRQALRSREGKLALRTAMRGIIPAEMIDRAKQGFSAPDESWFRGDSIDYVNRLLRSPKAQIYDVLNYEAVGRYLDQHTTGQSNRRLLIWSLLSVEWWLRTFVAR
jgi:asparagine synthase (glutamine-hydrolysing)